MSHVRVCLLTAYCVSLGACGIGAVGGSGTVTTEPRTVSGFSSVSLSGSGQLTIAQTGAESLTVTTDDNLLQYIKTEVNGNTLELGSKDSMTGISPTSGIVYKLTVRTLDGLSVSGSGQAEVKGINPDQLRIHISGSGEVSAEGTANDLSVSISGSGDYNGDGMKSRRATAEISGSGSAVIAASDQLKADVSGSGSVQYVGSPQVTEHVSGSGSVRKR